MDTLYWPISSNLRELLQGIYVLKKEKLFTLSFNLLLAIDFILMIGYITFKISLAVFLNHDGYSLNDAYSISTSSLSLFAICCVVWGYVNKEYEQRKNFVLLSLGMLALAFGLMLLKSTLIQLLGISMFVIGSSLYTTNITLLINDQFNSTSYRQQGNQAIQWIINLGCLFGIAELSLAPTIITFKQLYFISGLFVLASFCILFICKKNITEIVYQKIPLMKLVKMIITIGGIYLLVFILLSFAAWTRSLSFILFLIGASYISFLSFKEKNKKYLEFLIILTLCGATYWLSFSIVSNQFSVFLIHNAQTNFLNLKLSSLSALIFDPLANVLCGAVIYFIYRHFLIKESNMLATSILLNFIAFGVIVLSIKLFATNEKVALLWPIICISLYATAEFLLVTTMNSQISSLIDDRKRRGIFLGMQKLCIAFSSTIAYYLINLSEANKATTHAIQSSGNLYFFIMLISLTAFILLLFFKKLRLINV